MEASSAPAPVPGRFLDDGKMFKGSKEVAAFECGICKKKKFDMIAQKVMFVIQNPLK